MAKHSRIRNVFFLIVQLMARLAAAMGALLISGASLSGGQNLLIGGQSSISAIDIRQAGVRGDGTDESVGFQRALYAAEGKILFIPANFRIVLGGNGQIQIPGGPVTIAGAGASSVLEWSSSIFNTDLFVAESRSTTLTIRDVTINENETGDQVHKVSAIKFMSGGENTSPAALIIQNVKFENGRYSEITFGAEDTQVRNLRITDSNFLGGADGNADFDPRYVSVLGAATVFIERNTFDFERTPTGTGRAGITVSGGQDAARSTVFVNSNSFHQIGRSSSVKSHGTLGSIYFYSNVADASITGNYVDQPWGAGIIAKSHAYSLIISGNIIDGLNQSISFNPGQTGFQLGSFGSSANPAGGNHIISGNILRNSKSRGLVYEGNSTISNAVAQDVIISGNIVTNVAGDYGLLLQNSKRVAVTGNIVQGGTNCIVARHIRETLAIVGNSFGRSTGDCVTLIASGPDNTVAQISLNTIDGAGRYGVQVTGSSTISIRDNMISGAIQGAINVDRISGQGIIEGNVISGSDQDVKIVESTKVWAEDNIFAVPGPGYATATNLNGIINVHSSQTVVDCTSGTEIIRVIEGVPAGRIITVAGKCKGKGLIRFQSNTGDVRTGNLWLRGDFSSDRPERVITLVSRGEGMIEIGRTD